MRILLLCSAYNGLSQRTQVELETLGHDISVSLALSADTIRRNVLYFQPDLIICPFLKEKVPEDIWRRHTCLIVHPGIVGDRGPSSLDWAIMNEEQEWGVTVLQAVEEMDAGDIWAAETFVIRQGNKASLYRHEVTNAAVKAILTAVERFESQSFHPEPLDYSKEGVRGRLRPLMRQTDRKIDWASDTVADIIKKINAADSFPGVLDCINNREYYLYGAHEEKISLFWQNIFANSLPGSIIGQRNGAILRMATDGLVWITHLKQKISAENSLYKRLTGQDKPSAIKLPAAMVLARCLDGIPELPIDSLYMDDEVTFKEIHYEEINQVGYLHFDFHNGAMSTRQCQRLLESYRLALQRPTKVLVLMGGREFWSNGIHLNIIEAAKNPSQESWENINAINDFVLAVLTTDTKITVSAVWGGCGAGGAMAILAADKVWARQGVVFNPHYRLMGLYGSEYWTYSLPKRVGPLKALELTQKAIPLGTQKAKKLGYIDDIFPNDYDAFIAHVQKKAEDIAHSPLYQPMLETKAAIRQRDEQTKPLAAYRAAELQKMKLNFAGKGEINYHTARFNFVYKVKPKETAPCLAKNSYDFAGLQALRVSSVC